jgi:hypothetical protein
VLAAVLGGSNLSDVGYGPMTGNASADVAAHQFAKGDPGYQLQAGDAYFREGCGCGQTSLDLGRRVGPALPGAQ